MRVLATNNARDSAWRLVNAIVASVCVVLSFAMAVGCGAGGVATVPQADVPPANSAALAAEADPLLARVKALAARRASSRSASGNTAPASTGAGPAAAADVGGGASTRSRGPGLAGVLPPLKTETASTGCAWAPGKEAIRDFTLGPGDEIDLVVSGQAEFSGAVTVRADGTVALPTTGDLVRASGLKQAEFAEAVATAVSPRYVKTSPAVSAVVRRSPRLTYYVFGAVRRPGRYEMPPGGVAVMDAVMRATAEVGRKDAGIFDSARGPLEFVPVEGAVYSRVRVVAPASGDDAVRIVDVARAMRGGAEALERVGPGEIVIVPSKRGDWTEDRLRSQLARAMSRIGSAPASGSSALSVVTALLASAGEGDSR